MSLIYKYSKFPRKDLVTGKIVGEYSRPQVPMRLVYKHQLSRWLINALVDSGSDINLFPAEIGEVLGVKIKKGKVLNVGG